MQGPGTQGGPEGEEPALLTCPVAHVDFSLWGLACDLVRHRAHGRGPYIMLFPHPPGFTCRDLFGDNGRTGLKGITTEKSRHSFVQPILQG